MSESGLTLVKVVGFEYCDFEYCAPVLWHELCCLYKKHRGDTATVVDMVGDLQLLVDEVFDDGSPRPQHVIWGCSVESFETVMLLRDDWIWPTPQESAANSGAEFCYLITITDDGAKIHKIEPQMQLA